jgi:voltage-gated potassium channel Kch
MTGRKSAEDASVSDGAVDARSTADPVAGAPVTEPAPARDGRPRHVIILGFGLSGRTAVNAVIAQGVSYTVIEANRSTVERCTPGGLNIIQGDARSPVTLKQAGIDRATEIAVTVPNDQITLTVVEQARRMNPQAHIMARCTFVSGGMEAHRRGADETVISEQVVASEFGRVVAAALGK